MPRPIDRATALKLKNQKKLKYHSLVDWNGKKYVIWADGKGPIYSTVAKPGEYSVAALQQEGTIYIGDVYDTITHRVMESRRREPSNPMSRGMFTNQLVARWA